MSVTAQQVTIAALQRLGVLASGETPTATELTDGMTRLNQMLDSWSASGVMIPYLSLDTHSLTSATSYTIGLGQTINTARPLVLKSASVVASGFEQILEIVTAEKWQAIADKTRAGKLAKVLLFAPSSATAGTVYVWPAANGALLQMWSYKALTQFPDLNSTSLTFPPGYERSLVASHAVELASEYGVAVPEALMLTANEAKNAIAALNQSVLGGPVSQTPAEA